MVVPPRIYTKTGDTGDTGLFDGTRVLKSDARVDAYGEVDELSAFLGLARCQLSGQADLLDLLAALSFDRGPSSVGSRRSIRWRVHAVRADFGTEPDRIPRDAESGRLMERFTLERLA